MATIQHRYPFLLVDRILELEPGVRAVGLKNVTMNEEFFNGHFPGNPIMPGVLIVEHAAQVGGILLLATTGNDPAAVSNVQALRTALEDYGATFNVFSFLSTSPLGLPSLLAGRGPVATPAGRPVMWLVSSVPLYLLLWGTFVLLGLLLGAFYFGIIAQQVRDAAVSGPRSDSAPRLSSRPTTRAATSIIGVRVLVPPGRPASVRRCAAAAYPGSSGRSIIEVSNVMDSSGRRPSGVVGGDGGRCEVGGAITPPRRLREPGQPPARPG
jgi:hypothetical protein